MEVLFSRPDRFAKAAVFAFCDLVFVTHMVLAAVKSGEGPLTLAALEPFVGHYGFFWRGGDDEVVGEAVWRLNVWWLGLV